MIFDESRTIYVMPLGILGWAAATGVVARLADEPGVYLLTAVLVIAAVASLFRPKPPGLRVKGSILSDILERERRRVLTKLGSREALEPREVQAVYDLFQAMIDHYRDQKDRVYQATGRLVEPRDEVLARE